MKITVFKYDPATDSEPYYISGEVPYKEKMTGMEALMYFHENIAAVNFDYSCVCRLCGRCAMMLDGVPCMICVTPIEDKDHIFEPLKGYPVVRDLVVDKTAMDNQLSGIFDRVRVEPYNEETIHIKNYDDSTTQTLYALEFCARCGVCNAACPVLAAKPTEFIGPAGMLAIGYRHLDQLDQGDRVMEAVSKGLYHCIQCGMCDTVCAQQDIDHLGVWKLLRSAAEKRGLKPSYAD